MSGTERAAFLALERARQSSRPIANRAHGIHPYPGMLARHLARAVLGGAWPGIAHKPGGIVFDPFCGAGTVLLEAQLAGIPSVGWDSNPLACLISRVKTQPVRMSAVTASLNRVVRNVESTRDVPPPDVVNIEYWYSDRVCDGLSRLAHVVNSLRPSPTNDLLRLGLSKTAMQLSLANPRFPVPVKLQLDHYQEGSEVHRQLSRHLREAHTEDPISRFETNVRSMAIALEAVRLETSTAYHYSSILEHDAREHAEGVGDAALILTSPPYPGAQKYSRFSSLSLGWLQLVRRTDLRGLEDRLIGREHFRKQDYEGVLPRTMVPDADRLLRDIGTRNQLRAYIGAIYLLEMRQTLQNLAIVLAPGGSIVIVVAASRFLDQLFDTPAYLIHMAKAEGLRLVVSVKDTIRSRRLVTTRRNGARPIAEEYVLHFRGAHD